MGERTKSAVKSFLPRGGSLPYEQWERRHRVIVALLWIHAVGLTIFGLIRGYSVPHILADTSVIATAAVFASWKRLGRKLQATVAAFGLVAGAGVFVPLAGGGGGVHLHYLV